MLAFREKQALIYITNRDTEIFKVFIYIYTYMVSMNFAPYPIKGSLGTPRPAHKY